MVHAEKNNWIFRAFVQVRSTLAVDIVNKYGLGNKARCELLTNVGQVPLAIQFVDGGIVNALVTKVSSHTHSEGFKKRLGSSLTVRIST